MFRPVLPDGYVDEEGYADLSQAAIEEAAGLLGWVPETDVVRELKRQVGLKLTQNAKQAATIKGLEARIQELEHLLQNAR